MTLFQAPLALSDMPNSMNSLHLTEVLFEENSHFPNNPIDKFTSAIGRNCTTSCKQVAIITYMIKMIC